MRLTLKQKPPTAQKRSSAEASFRSAFAQRLKLATKKHDIGELASKIGVTPATLYRWLNAKFDPSLPKLAELAEAMNVNLAWLVSGTGPVDARRALRHALLEEYEITEFESAGSRRAKSPIAFYEPWLLELLFGPPGEPTVFGATDMNFPLLMEMGEDSMEPTIAKGDLLLIDRAFGQSSAERRRVQSEGRSVYDGIHAFKSSSLPGSSNDSTSHLIIRRTQYRLDGTMVVRCDNPKYPEEVYPLRAQKRPVPVGRVLWRGTRI
jgi:phage repressor protein C with HTH and peptisase S24 domain